MKTTFYLTHKQASTIQLVGALIILSLVAFALLTGDINKFNSTYLG